MCLPYELRICCLEKIWVPSQCVPHSCLLVKGVDPLVAHAAQDCEVRLVALASVPSGPDVVHMCLVKFISQFSASWTFYSYVPLVVRQALSATGPLRFFHFLLFHPLIQFGLPRFLGSAFATTSTGSAGPVPLLSAWGDSSSGSPAVAA